MTEPAIRALIAKLHRYTITSEGASKGYFRLVEDFAGAWVTWAEVEALLVAGEAAETPIREAFRAGFNAQPDSESPNRWCFDGKMAGDIEPSAWTAWAASLSPAVPLHETRKPFKMTVSKEWIEKMAKAEEECGDVSVGGAGAVESIEVAALRRIALGNLDIHQAILIARSTLGDKL